ncbi:MAG: IS1595 family transposase [Hyphomicrobiales bacterium]|nr:MAG: IS1595 family transposase [Hyphomicrobiales bacterium]
MNITDLRFQDPDKAREYLEAQRWPDGPVCPHCGNCDQDKITGLRGKAHRPGVYQCNECREQFTVTVGSIMERSKIPLNKWLLAMHLLGASKKGMSAHQLHRMLGITYQSAWFLCHRIREAMKPTNPSPLGGGSKVIESDETFIGGKAKNRAYAKKEPKKQAVMTLVERNGESRSFHVANVKAKTLREKIVTTVSRKSHLMTDELASYEKVGKEFANHGTVNHSADEYARLGGFVHVNTAECRFSLMKRAVYGTHRYLAEWDFKWNTRKINDGERAALIAKGIEGKRLMYRAADRTANA